MDNFRSITTALTGVALTLGGASGVYAQQAVEDVNAPQSGNPFFSGYHLTGSWAVTGEIRGYRKRSGTFDPLPIATPVNRGGWGAVELAFRFSQTDLHLPVMTVDCLGACYDE